MDIDLRLRDLEKRARERSGGRPIPLRDWVALAEAWRIAEALRDARGNRTAAARSLGIGRRTLYSKMEKLGFGCSDTAQGLGSGGTPAGRNQHIPAPSGPLATP
jgi:DNA-binding NtrC family response regulator